MTRSLGQINNFLLDMDGTLYLGSQPFDGAGDLLKTIKNAGKKYLLLTNNSSMSVAEYHDRLARMNLTVKAGEVFSSATATIIYLKQRNAGKKLFLLATPGVCGEFEDEGFVLTDKAPDFVVLTFDKTLTYQKLEKACRLLLGGTEFIATHPDIVCPTENLPIPDCGAIIKTITAATGVRPKIIGKPNSEMITSALSRLNASAEETAIVGDRLYTDMEMGFRSGLTTVLVLTGETKIADLDGAKRRPDYVLPSIRELSDLIPGDS